MNDVYPSCTLRYGDYAGIKKHDQNDIENLIQICIVTLHLTDLSGYGYRCMHRDIHTPLLHHDGERPLGPTSAYHLCAKSSFPFSNEL